MWSPPMPDAAARRALVAVLAALCSVGLGACKSRPAGVAVTEAPPVGAPTPPTRYLDGDTTYSDSAYALVDSLAETHADSLARPPTTAVDSVPDFDVFWAAFRAAVRSGRRADLAALAAPGADVTVLAEPFRTPLLALDARDLAREPAQAGGAARVATATVGFDAAGSVVPQDEADTDRTVALHFEIVGGAWRLVRTETAG